MADTPVAPPLPTGSVDFNAVHTAAKRGHDLVNAIEKATTVVETPKAASADTATQPDKGE